MLGNAPLIRFQLAQLNAFLASDTNAVQQLPHVRFITELIVSTEKWRVRHPIAAFDKSDSLLLPLSSFPLYPTARSNEMTLDPQVAYRVWEATSSFAVSTERESVDEKVFF